MTTGDASSGPEPHQLHAAAGDDAELDEVLARWATLPEAMRRAVLALVRSVR